MLKKAAVIQVDRFRGMNKALAAPKIPDGDFVNLQNMRVFQGDLITRAGGALHFTASGMIQALYDFRRTDIEDGVRNYFIEEHGGIVYNLVNGVESVVKSGLSTSQPCSFVTLQGLMIGCDGASKPFAWDGQGAAYEVNGPQAKFLRAWNNHVFAAGIAGLPNNLRVSETGDGSKWVEPVVEFQFDAGNGNSITGLGAPGDRLAIYQQDSIWVLGGNSRTTFVIDQVISGKDGKGAVSHDGIVTVNKVDYYISKANVCAFDGSKVVELGDVVAREFIQKLAQGRLEKIKGRYVSKYNEIHWACSTGASNINDAILVMNMTTGGFYVFKGINAEAIEIFEQEQGLAYLYTGSNAGLILRQDSGQSDNGAAISYIIESKAHAIGGQPLFKRHRNVILYCRSFGAISATFEHWFDQDESLKRTQAVSVGAGSTLWDVAVWDVDVWDGIELRRTIAPIIGVGRQIHWRLSFSSTTARFELQSYAVEGRPRGLR